MHNVYAFIPIIYSLTMKFSIQKYYCEARVSNSSLARQGTVRHVHTCLCVEQSNMYVSLMLI